MNPLLRWIHFVGLFVSFVVPTFGQETLRLGLAGSTRTWADRSDEFPAYLRGLRTNRAAGGWNVELTVSNVPGATFRADWIVVLESSTNVVGIDRSTASDSRRILGPFTGAPVAQTLRLLVDRGVPTLSARVFEALPDAVGFTGRVLDSDGLPLETPASVEEIGPSSPTAVSTGRRGWFSTVSRPDVRGWRLSAPGRWPAFRPLESIPAGVPDSLVLVPSNGPAATLEVFELPAPLPAGWTPLAAAAFPAGSFELGPGGTTELPEGTAVVRWNAGRLAWEALGNASRDPSVRGVLSDAAILARVRPDVGSGAVAIVPVAEGAILSGNPGGVGVATVSASGRIDPAGRNASTNAVELQARGFVEFRSTNGPLASGTAFRCEIQESYQLRDGTRRVLPRWTTLVRAHRVDPADGTVLRGEFPLRPTQALGGEQLNEALVRVEVLAESDDRLVEVPAAGRVLEAGPVRVGIAAGAYPEGSVARIVPLETADLAGVLPDGASLAAAFELELAPGAAGASAPSVSVSGLAAGRRLVVARSVFDGSVAGYAPVLRLTTGFNGVAASAEPASGGLPGVDGGGQFIVVGVAGPQVVVRGTARNAAGTASPGLVVRSGPWTTLTGTDGRYELVAPAGSTTTTVTVTDRATGDVAQGTVPATVDGSVATLNVDLSPRGPFVVAASPAAGAVNVARVSPVSLNFSRPLNPGTVVVPGAVVLADATGAALPAAVSINPAGDTVTLLPTSNLPASAALRVVLSTNLADRFGRPLEGAREFGFTTEGDTLRRADAVLTLTELTGGMTGVTGGPGLADPEVAVVLVNETTGFTSTVLSMVDGSFSNSIPASVEDEVVAVLVNRNGTRNTIRPARQNFADGSTGVFAAGGEVRATGDGRTVELKVAPGSVSGRTRIKMDVMPRAAVDALVTNIPPNAGKVVSPGVVVTFSEDRFQGPVDIAIPITDAELRQAGLREGENPTNGVYALVVPMRVGDTISYMFVDQMEYADGKLVTRSGTTLNDLAAAGTAADPFLKRRGSGTAVGAKGVREDIGEVDAFAREGLRVLFDAAQDKNIEVQRFIREHAHELNMVAETVMRAVGLVMGFAGGGIAGGLQNTAIDALVNGAPLSHTPGQGRDVESVVDEAQRQTHILGLQQTAMAYVMLPLVMASQAVPAAFVGKVAEVDLVRGADGSFSEARARLLPGAMVCLHESTPGVFSNPRPGHLNRGTLFSISGRNGGYKIIRAGARSIGVPEDFFLTASHPRYFGRALRRAASPLAGRILSNSDFLFTRLVDDSSAPPQLRVAHSPDPVEPETDIEVEVVASAVGSFTSPVRPEIEVSIGGVDAVRGGPRAGIGDITFQFIRSEDISATSRRSIYRLRSAVRSVVTLRAAAYTPGNDRTLVRYPVRIGTGLERPDDSPPADLADITGPRVLRSEPAPSAAAWPLDRTILVEFNEAMNRSITNRPTGITLVPGAGEPSLQLSADGRTLSIAYPDLQPDTEYEMIVPPSVAVDASFRRNPLDQVPSTSSQESFTLRFRTAVMPSSTLPGLEIGGGVVIQGIYAYVLERTGPLDGAVVVYDLSDPRRPTKVGELSVPGFPRDIAHIPSYGLVVRPGEAPRERNLIAVGGGKVGSTFTREGEDLGGFQYLWVIDITNPTQPVRIASTVLSFSGAATLNRLVWSPPFLSAMISDSAIQQIDVIQLQSFVYGLNLTREEFRQIPLSGVRGVDANGDGDFIDFAVGDVLPLPGRREGTYAGLEARLATGDGFSGRWTDFHNNGRTIGVVAGAGRRLDSDRNPTGRQFAGAYRTLADSGDFLDPEAATFLFENDEPKRLFLLNNVPLPAVGGVRIGNAALISMRSAAGGGWLATLDITEPLRPTLVASNGLPTDLGIPQTAQLISGGRVALATSTDVLLLDAERLGESSTEDGVWPALLGRIPGVGSGARTYAYNRSGLTATSLGSRNAVAQAAPEIRFVRFMNRSVPVDPSTLHDSPEPEVATLLAQSEREGVLPPARVRGVPGVTGSSVSPSDPQVHHHVLVHAPGSAGPTIPLAVETLNSRGFPVGDKGLGFPPVRGLSRETVDSLGGTPDCTAVLRPLVAHRLSDNPGSALYNVYLSRAFLLVYESLDAAQLSELREGRFPREVYWSANSIRVGFDPALESENVLKPFAHQIRGGKLLPGVTATALGFSADYLMGPNPPPVTEATKVPGTFGTISGNNGEFRMETTDLVLPGRRLPIRFERAIGGQDLHEGVFGRGWDFLYNQRLVELAGSLFLPGTGMPLVVRENGPSEIASRRDLLLHTGRSRTLIYAYKGETVPPEIDADPLFQDLKWKDSADSYYVPQEGVFDFVVRFRDGRFARLEPDGTQVWYSPDGRLEEMRDRFISNRLQFEYDEEGALIRIVDRSVASRRDLILGYYRMDGQGDTGFPNERTQSPGESGKVCRLVDYTGRELRYYYNACGELERREGPRVSSIHPEGFNGLPVTRYEVSGSSDTPKANGIRGISAGSTAGSTLFTAETRPRSSVPVVNEARGAGASGAIALDFTAPGSGRVSTPDGGQTSMRFGPDQRLGETVFSGRGAGPATNAYEYAGSLLSMVVYPEGNSVSYEYHTNAPALRSRGNIRRVIRAAGPRGVAGPEPVPAEFLEFDPRYNFTVGETVDFAGRKVTYTKTPDGLEIGSIRYGGDAVVERTFNSFGQLASETGPQGISVSYEYDEITGFLKARVAGPDGPNLRTLYTYGPEGTGFNGGDLGLPTQIQPPKSDSEPVRMTYDEREQLVTRIRGSEETRISYDINGHPVRVETLLGGNASRVVTSVFEQNGFLRERTVHDVETVGADGRQALASLTTTYEPDEMFRVKRVVHPGNRIQEFHEFDHLGRPKRMTLGRHAEQYEYDLDGNLLSTTRGGATDRMRYDGFGRLRRLETAVDGDSEVAEFTYNPTGAVLTRTLKDAAGRLNAEVSMEHDALDRVVLQILTTDQGPTRRRFGYPRLANTVLIEASGEEIRSEFDSAGRALLQADSTRTVHFTPDANGNVIASRSVEAAITFQRFLTPDNQDRPRELADTVGPIATSGFRADGVVTSSRDALGNLTAFGPSKLGETLAIDRPNGVGFRYGFNDHRAPVLAQDRSGAGHGQSTDDTYRVRSTTLRSRAEILFDDFDPRNERPRRLSGAGLTADFTYDAKGRLRTGSLLYAGIPRDEEREYDALDRVTLAKFPGGEWRLGYDLLGPVKSATLAARGAEYRIAHRYRGDGAALGIDYPAPDPVSVGLGRDVAGRPTSVVPDELGPVVQETRYTGAALVGSQVLGTNSIRSETSYDLRGRTIGRRYLRGADNALLADVRYQYDPTDNVQVRQLVHRGGRADVFLYDSGRRLIAAHHGVRPAIPLATARAGFLPFDLPPGSESLWKPGFHSRSYQYDLQGLDTFLGSSMVNPDSLPALAFPTNFLGTDAFLLPQVVDGFNRGSDSLGNANRVRLLVWAPGAAEPTPVGATLLYDGRGQLVRIDRDDAVRIHYRYDHAGLLFERQVDAGGQSRITTLVWDQQRLIAEYDRTGGANELAARYHYFGADDVPTAMDRRGSDGVLRREYFLTDALGHVMALADAGGSVLSRYEYEAWGQFRPEATDRTPPFVARARKTPAGFSIEFSETVLPPGDINGFPVLDTRARDFGSVAEVVQAGEVVEGVWQYEETVPGAPFGSTLQFLSSRPLEGGIVVRVRPGVAFDVWLNPNPSQDFPLTLAANAGDAPVDLEPPPGTGGDAGTPVRSPFLFQGQYFDHEAGLIYMRARFYDPSTGLFLQPDPKPYEDSPNSYAAMRQNPTSMRDPSGRMAGPPKPPSSPRSSTGARGGARPPGGREEATLATPSLEETRAPYASSAPDVATPTTSRASSTGVRITGEGAPFIRQADINEALGRRTGEGPAIQKRSDIEAAIKAVEEGSIGQQTKFAEAIESRLDVNSKAIKRDVFEASGEEVFRHEIGMFVSEIESVMQAANINRSRQLYQSDPSRVGSKAYFGRGVYAWSGSKDLSSPHVEFTVPKGTVVESITTSDYGTFYRIVPKSGMDLDINIKVIKGFEGENKILFDSFSRMH